jgi:hypothetical protein
MTMKAPKQRNRRTYSELVRDWQAKRERELARHLAELARIDAKIAHYQGLTPEVRRLAATGKTLPEVKTEKALLQRRLRVLNQTLRFSRGISPVS